MSLKSQIVDDMKAAMRARDKFRLGTIRMLQAEIKQREVDSRSELDDAAVTAVVTKLLKQRRDAEQQFRDAGRDDLAEKEQAEAAVLAEYQPKQMTEAELTALIDQAIADSGAAGMKDMGKVMGLVKSKAEGKADMGMVSKLVKSQLS